MNKREATIITIHTDILCCDPIIFHREVESILEGSVFTHLFGDERFMEKLKEITRKEFMEIIKNVKD